MQSAGFRILVSSLHSNSITPALDSLYNLRHILLAGIVVGSFHHHADKRLGAGLAHQNAAGIAQCFSHSLDGLLHRRVILCGLLVGHTNIFQNLRVDLQRLSQLAHGQLLGKHYFHHLQTGQDTITRTGVLTKDDMTTLLTADTAAVLSHVLIDVLVTHSGLGVADALLIKKPYTDQSWT